MKSRAKQSRSGIWLAIDIDVAVGGFGFAIQPSFLFSQGFPTEDVFEVDGGVGSTLEDDGEVCGTLEDDSVSVNLEEVVNFFSFLFESYFQRR